MASTETIFRQPFLAAMNVFNIVLGSFTAGAFEHEAQTDPIRGVKGLASIVSRKVAEDESLAF